VSQGHEPATTRPVSTFDVRIGRALERVERALIYVVALFLIAFAVLALVDTVAQVNSFIILRKDYTGGIAAGIDSAFLTIILLELLHTVLSRGSISQQLQEFLVIGITSGVRRSLEIGVGSSPVTEKKSVTPASSRDVVIDLGINAAGVLVLVVALWLVRQQSGKGHGNDAPGLLQGEVD